MLSYFKISDWVKFGTDVTSSQLLMSLIYAFTPMFSSGKLFSDHKKLASQSSLPELSARKQMH